MKKLLFAAILFSSVNVFGQTETTPTPEGINNNPTPTKDVVTDPNTGNNDTGVITEPAKEENGNPNVQPIPEGIDPRTKTPTPTPSETDNTGPVEATPN